MPEIDLPLTIDQVEAIAQGRATLKGVVKVTKADGSVYYRDMNLDYPIIVAGAGE